MSNDTSNVIRQADGILPHVLFDPLAHSVVLLVDI